jgi:hypothetical protein
MVTSLGRPVSGHVFRVERARGPVWYAKYRLPDGRQVQKCTSPSPYWTQTRAWAVEPSEMALLTRLARGRPRAPRLCRGDA